MVILPRANLLVEQANVVADTVPAEQLVELLVVHAVRPLAFAVQMRCPRADVDMADVAGFRVPVELGLELGPVVGLYDVHAKRWSPQDFVCKLDRRLLKTVEPRVGEQCVR